MMDSADVFLLFGICHRLRQPGIVFRYGVVKHIRDVMFFQFVQHFPHDDIFLKALVNGKVNVSAHRGDFNQKIIGNGHMGAEFLHPWLNLRIFPFPDIADHIGEVTAAAVQHHGECHLSGLSVFRFLHDHICHTGRVCHVFPDFLFAGVLGGDFPVKAALLFERQFPDRIREFEFYGLHTVVDRLGILYHWPGIDDVRVHQRSLTLRVKTVNCPGKKNTDHRTRACDMFLGKAYVFLFGDRDIVNLRRCRGKAGILQKGECLRHLRPVQCGRRKQGHGICRVGGFFRSDRVFECPDSGMIRKPVTFCAVVIQQGCEHHVHPGAAYSSNGIIGELQTILAHMYNRGNIRFRGDSAFYDTELLKYLESEEIRYYIRAKSTTSLRRTIFEDIVSKDIEWLSYTSAKPYYGEIRYSISGSKTERRIVYKAYSVREDGQLMLLPTIYGMVTNDDVRTPKEAMDFYEERGASENFTKEFKNDFDGKHLSHSNFYENAMEFLISDISYSIFHLFQNTVLTGKDNLMTMNSFRMKFQKVAVKVAHHARKITLSFSSAYQHRRLFMKYWNLVLKM